MQRVVVPVTALLLSFLAAATPLLSSEGRGGPAEVLSRYYYAHHLAPGDAYGMLLARCGALQSRHDCSGSHNVSKDHFLIRAAGSTHAALAEYLREIDVPRPTRLFQLTLLLRQPGPARARAFPEGISEALGEIEDLFPRRDFRLLGSGAMRIVESGSLVLGDPPGYEARIRLSRERSPESAVQVERFELRSRRYVPREAGGMSITSDTLVHTAFGIQDGETVVVGTSTHESGEPLIVLLSAAR